MLFFDRTAVFAIALKKYRASLHYLTTYQASGISNQSIPLMKKKANPTMPALRQSLVPLIQPGLPCNLIDATLMIALLSVPFLPS